jgi:hypothetical protein
MVVALNILLHLLDTPFIDNLSPQYAADVGQAVARGSQLALDIMETFTKDDPYRICLFA